MNDDTQPESTENTGGFAESALDLVGDAITGIPALIRKNLGKAIGQLSTVLIKYPASLIENKIAENKAASDSRIKIIKEASKQIISGINVDEAYSRIASEKFSQKIIKEQLNLDKITSGALNHLSNTDDSEHDSAVKDIGDDWLDHFESEARNVSSDDMQLLFSRILAGEISKPDSFSSKTLNVVSEIDDKVAVIFRKLCSLSFALIYKPNNLIIDIRAPIIGNKAVHNGLIEYGLSFDNLNLLLEHGLIIPDYDSYYPYNLSILGNNNIVVPFKFQGKTFVFSPKENLPVTQEFRVEGVALSKAGKELFSIVDIEEVPVFYEVVKEYFDKRGYALREATYKK